jgi:hypothetical protein
MTLNKNKTRKAVVAVYATEWDIKHPTILRLAYNADIIPKEQFQQILKVENQIDVEISPEQLSLILENYFGFSCGEYEEHLIEGSQVNKIGGGRVENVKRYTGWERLDNEWVGTGLASREAYELCKYGEVLAL